MVVTIIHQNSHLMDSDNLAGAAKGLRDKIAAWLGCDDSPTDPVRWVVDQCPGEPGTFVRIEPMTRRD